MTKTASTLKPTLALAIGDPNGIGPEIAVKAAADHKGARIILVGDARVLQHYAAKSAPDFELAPFAGEAIPRENTLEFFDAACLRRADFAPGQISASAGKATVGYVQASLDLVRAGKAQAIVACPHNETAVNAAGIKFSGYPDLIAQLCGLPEGSVFLMLVGGGLRIVHATLHERIHNALARLSPELIAAAGGAAHDALQQLGIAAPRVGLFGVNPHAGEGGLFGDDDERLNVPARALLQARGIHAEGPVGADTMLARKDIDAFVAMYHDQGHIPVKLVAGRTASALSIGAGVLFSTVGHGSGFDIAGKGVADPEGVLRTLALLGGMQGGVDVTV